VVSVLAVIVYDAVPVPDPEPLTVAHDADEDAVHAQPDCVVTDNVPLAPLDPGESASGLTVKVQGADSLIVKVLPAIVSVVERAEPVSALTLNPTEPEPLPDAPLVMVAHAAPLDAVQLHPAPAVTVTVPVPPADAND